MAWIAGWGLSFIIFNVAVEVLQLSKVLHRSCPDRKGDGLLERFSRAQQGLLWHVRASREFHAFSRQEDVGTLLLEFFRYFGHEYRWGEGFKMKPALHALSHPPRFVAMAGVVSSGFEIRDLYFLLGTSQKLRLQPQTL